MTDPAKNTTDPQTAVLMEKLVLLILFIALLAGVLLVLMPFSVGVMFGGIIAIAAWPLRRMLRGLGLSTGVTAFLLLLLVIAIIVVPVLVMAPNLAHQLTGLFEVVVAWIGSSPPPPIWLQSIPLVGDTLHEQWIRLLGSSTAAKDMLAPYAESSSAGVLAVAKGLGESLVQVVLAMVFATMFWAQGELAAATFADSLRRLGGNRLVEMAVISVNAVRGVFYGVVGTAAIQAAMMTLGLLLAGVPGAAPLGFLTLLLALSQVGGLLIHLVWGGSAYWLYTNGETGLHSLVADDLGRRHRFHRQFPEALAHRHEHHHAHGTGDRRCFRRLPVLRLPWPVHRPCHHRHRLFADHRVAHDRAVKDRLLIDQTADVHCAAAKI